MLSRSRSELEADFQASDARYRELVQQTLSVIRHGSGPGVEARKILNEIDRQRRSVLCECNRLFAQLQGDSMEKVVLTCVACGKTESVENLPENKRDKKCAGCGDSMIEKRHPGNFSNA